MFCWATAVIDETMVHFFRKVIIPYSLGGGNGLPHLSGNKVGLFDDLCDPFPEFSTNDGDAHCAGLVYCQEAESKLGFGRHGGSDLYWFPDFAYPF